MLSVRVERCLTSCRGIALMPSLGKQVKGTRYNTYPHIGMRIIDAASVLVRWNKKGPGSPAVAFLVILLGQHSSLRYFTGRAAKLLRESVAIRLS